MGKHTFILRTCSDCRRKWLARKDYKPRTSLCSDCLVPVSMLLSDNPSWKGGRIVHKGYILVKLITTDPLYCMKNNHGYVAEHRLVMARHLGRPLTREEVIHHIDGNKQNNVLSNLKLTTNGTHPHRYREAYELGYKQGFTEGARQNSRGD